MTSAVAGVAAVLLHLQQRAMAASTSAELYFTIVNETHHLSPYRQAAFFEINGRTPRLAAASGLVSTEENSPYTVWLNRFARGFDGNQAAQVHNFAQASMEHRESWQEWLPEHLLSIPLKANSGAMLGYALYAREQAWNEAEINALLDAHQSYAYCLNHLTGGKPRQQWLAKLFSRKGLWFLAGTLTALMLLPVRLSALAPAEVIAFNPFSVASPQDGVIQSFAVAPNTLVKKGDLLFALDNTAVGNRYAVALKALEVAKADALVAEQRAFDDAKGKADLASALGRVREKEAELKAVETQKNRIEIHAERDGIAVFSDTNDWIGRPVQTGERVMQIADPGDTGVLVWLPVQDALNLEIGAPIKLFLHTQPLRPVAAKLQETSYQASLSPDNVASYRLKGRFIDNEGTPRIGLRGTARISGDWSVLGYYLFRRPIAAFRAWSGL